MGTWLEFDRVISADRASDVHTPSFSCHRCAHTKLFLPSMCTHQAFLAIDVHITGPAAAIPTGVDSMQFPRWSANRSSPSRAIDVHTPSFSCHRCAHNRASSSSPHGRDPVGCSSSDQRRPGQQQQSPREWTRLDVPRVIIAEPGQQQSPREGTRCSSLDGRQIDHRRPGQRCAHTKLFLPAMCTHQAFLAIDVHITGPAAAVPKGGTRLDVPSMVGKSIIAEPGHVSKHWMKVCRPDG
jgi:hypothetical protein